MNEFKLEDIKIASFLFVKGAKYLGVDITKRGFNNKFFFIFEDTEKCEKLKLEYMNGGEAPVMRLFECRELLMTEAKNKAGRE